MGAEKLEISYIPLSQAVLWDRNPKKHDIEAIIASIVKHGFKDPPKFEPELNGGRGGFAVGNGRTIALQMMKKRGDEPPRGIIKGDDGGWIIPVLFGVDAKSQAAAESYGIDHNNLTLLGGDFGVTDTLSMWDDGIANILSDLMAVDELPVSVADEDIAAILATLNVELPEEEKPLLPDQGPQIDRAEELQKVWKVETGQVWRCGEHYVICGDCREPETWQKLLGAAGVEKVDGVFTSPPYAEQRKKQYGGVPTDQYVEWWDAVQQNVKDNLAEDGSFFVNIKPHCEKGQRVLYVFDLVLAMVRRWGWRFVDELCWKKNGLPGDYKIRFRNDFEPIYQFCGGDVLAPRFENVLKHGRAVRGSGTGSEMQGLGGSNMGKTMEWNGMVRPGNVIAIPPDITTGHQAAFPVSLPDFFIKAYSDEGDVWVDPFLGSGTTIVAAHNNGRRGIGIERLEKYVSVCLQRFKDAFGVEPVLLG